MKRFYILTIVATVLLSNHSYTQHMNTNKEVKTQNVLVIGASGSLAKFVIDTLQKVKTVKLTLLARDRKKIANDTSNCKVVEVDVMDYPRLQKAIEGQDIVYINLAGDLETMTNNIVKAMHEASVKRVIAISSIGIYATPLPPVLASYRKLADILESSGLDYAILRPNWFTNVDEIDYAITHKGKPEKGTAISRKSIAAFIASVVQNPETYKNQNLGISKPN